MQVVHYKVGKVNFEIGTKRGAVSKYKENNDFGIKNVLDSEVV
jgi:ribosome maturation protein Sdo1